MNSKKSLQKALTVHPDSLIILGGPNRESCLEKHIFSLQYLVKCQELGAESDKYHQISEEIFLAESNLDEADFRTEKLKEEIGSFHSFLEHKDWKNFYSKITEIVKIIRPLNVAEIKRLTGKIKQASGIIKNKEILLVLG